MTARVRRRVVVTTADQLFSSASNFVVGLAVARISGPAGFGAYALAFAVWLFVVGVQRALVTDAMIILGDPKEEGSGSGVNSGLASVVCLGLLASLATATAGIVVYVSGDRTLGSGLLGVAPWLVFLLLQDYWRWVGFMQGTPEKALLNDVVFTAGQVVLYTTFVVSGFDTPWAALAAWGLGALAGSLLGLRQFSIRRPVAGVRAHFAGSWPTSRWLLGDTLTGWLSGQAYVITIGVTLGAVGLGAFRAAQTLTGPLGVLLQVGGSIGLPEAARGYQRDGLPGLRRVCAIVTFAGVVSAAAFGLVIFIGSDELMARVFGEEYRRYGQIAVLVSVANIIGAFGLGTLLDLKVRGLTRSLFAVRLIGGAISIASVFLLASRLGVATAGWAVVITTVVNVLGLLYKSRRPSGTSSTRVEPSTGLHSDVPLAPPRP